MRKKSKASPPNSASAADKARPVAMEKITRLKDDIVKIKEEKHRSEQSTERYTLEVDELQQRINEAKAGKIKEAENARRCDKVLDDKNDEIKTLQEIMTILDS